MIRRLEHVSITILGSGRSVIGQALSVDLTRDEVLKILTDGFLPITAPDDMPARGRPDGLRELGLPYASDPAITRHLAAFLTQAAVSHERSLGEPGNGLNPTQCSSMADSARRRSLARGLSRQSRPGSVEPKAAGGPRSSITTSVESAVARGAAYYGRYDAASVCASGPAARAPTTSGCARTTVWRGSVSCLPESNEGTTLPLLDREFSVLANRPVSFTLLQFAHAARCAWRSCRIWTKRTFIVTLPW